MIDAASGRAAGRLRHCSGVDGGSVWIIGCRRCRSAVDGCVQMQSQIRRKLRTSVVPRPTNLRFSVYAHRPFRSYYECMDIKLTGLLRISVDKCADSLTQLFGHTLMISYKPEKVL